QSIGFDNNNVRGQMVFSKTGAQLALVAPYFGVIDLFDFDRCSGLISNWRDLGEHPANPSGDYWGCAFSFNENVLYAAGFYGTDIKDSKLYQYNLLAADIKASK